MDSDSDYQESLRKRPKSSTNANGKNTVRKQQVSGNEQEQPGALEDQAGGGYAWEDRYQRSWDLIQEDAQGALDAERLRRLQLRERLRRQRRRRHVGRVSGAPGGGESSADETMMMDDGEEVPIQRGLLRQLLVVLDGSVAMTAQDFKPSYWELSIKLLLGFVAEFFDQNPLGQLGLIATCEGKAQLLTTLSGNPSEHKRALEALQKDPGMLHGQPSIQHALSLALTTFQTSFSVNDTAVASREGASGEQPDDGGNTSSCREIVCLMGALTTRDPGDIFEVVEQLKLENIRCSCIHLQAQVRAFQLITQQLQGTYNVATQEEHCKELLWDHVSPPPVLEQELKKEWIKMGFPRPYPHAALCHCHHEYAPGLVTATETSKGISTVSSINQNNCHWQCPHCLALHCHRTQLPCHCVVCGLKLVWSPHLARSFHHLFPVPIYTWVGEQTQLSTVDDGMRDRSAVVKAVGSNRAQDDDTGQFQCLSCLATRPDWERHQCPRCHQSFCPSCDLFIHDHLHNCPGCLLGESGNRMVIDPAK